MIRTIALLCAIAAPTLGGLFGNSDVILGGPSLKVRYDANPLANGKTAFMDMPTDVDSAVKKGWIQVEGPTRPTGYESLEMYCSQEDYTVCLLFDPNTGYVAGLQIALDKTKYETAEGFDMAPQGFTDWSTTVNGESVDFYTSAQYYVSAETLANGSKNISPRNESRLLQDDGVWLTGFNGELLKVSTDTSQWDDGPFTEQACFPWMGHHYYYNMTSAAECTDKTLFPYFLLKYRNEVVGIGFGVFGKLKVTGTQYNEEPPELAVKLIVPKAPQCFYDLAGQGVITMHTFFYKSPQSMTCLFESLGF